MTLMRLSVDTNDVAPSSRFASESEEVCHPLALPLWLCAFLLSCIAGVYLSRFDGLMAGIATLAAFLSLLGVASACPHMKH